jgi:uncharacterized protein (TIGR00255 family)
MKSMTGYGSGEACGGELTVSVELRSYNSRFLEINVNLPPFLSSFEGFVRDYLSGRCRRGKVEVMIKVRDEGTPEITVNKNAAQGYFQALRDLALYLGLDEKPGLSQVLSLEGVLQAEGRREDARCQAIAAEALEKAFGAFEAQREMEGRRTRENILSLLGTLAEGAGKIRRRLPELEQAIAAGIRRRFTEVLGDSLDEGRILTETAALLVRYSIAEENARLEGHLGEFLREINENPAPGKKLDFLSQEINREVNTIGAKTPSFQTSLDVVSMKEALEDIREQLRNVE